ncbi:hypothetical protein C1645_783517 [Glomus cerebriforme]|uniref:Uncharacterized protein n=1 Tax=Glomus cerebriforme TaxID=658196 RepID=A0A397SEP7_9GLOM|nr:hypothetical protein C1645_783517 [Glomus cerebriforme]
MGGFISILSALYLVLFGSKKVNPWGIVQRYIFKSRPMPPDQSYSDNNLEKGTLSQSHTYSGNGPQTNNQFTDDYIMPIPQDASPIQSSMTDTYSSIQQIRHELKAEVQSTIARER